MLLQSNIRFALLTFGLAGLSLAVAHPAAANTNLVQNAGFEMPVAPNPPGYTNNVITSWTGTGTDPFSFGVQLQSAFPSLYPTPGLGPNNKQYAYVNAGDIFQNITANFSANNTYTLSALLGIRTDITIPSTGHIYLETANGGTILAGAAGLTSPKGTFTRYSFTFTPTTTLTGVRVDLGMDAGSQQINFDDARLTATPVSPAPEPAEVATLSMISLGLGSLLLFARKRKAGQLAA